MIMDKRWYQVIAGSKYDGKKWIYHDQTVHKIKSQSLMEKIADSMSQLRYVAFEAVQIFNYYSPESAHITFIVNEDPINFNLQGVMMIRFNSFVKIIRNDPYILMQLGKNQSYQTEIIASVKFIPKEDEFTGILWQNQKGMILDDEQLIKCAIKELVRSCEI